MREDNLPLQIQLYFSSYVSMLQRRKILDHSTTDSLIRIIDEFQHTLTGLEKIVTTPIPFSYLVHLNHVSKVPTSQVLTQLLRSPHGCTLVFSLSS